MPQGYCDALMKGYGSRNGINFGIVLSISQLQFGQTFGKLKQKTFTEQWWKHRIPGSDVTVILFAIFVPVVGATGVLVDTVVVFSEDNITWKYKNT